MDKRSRTCLKKVVKEVEALGRVPKRTKGKNSEADKRENCLAKRFDRVKDNVPEDLLALPLTVPLLRLVL